MIISTPTLQQQQQQLVVKEPEQPSTQLQPRLLPPPASLVNNVPELGRFASFDCEWYREDLKKNQEMGRAGNIYAFCLVDSQGSVNRFTSSRTFMSAILDVMERYTTLAGYSIFSNEYRNFYSDIDHIASSCDRVGAELSDRFSSIKSKIEFLDAHKILMRRLRAF